MQLTAETMVSQTGSPEPWNEVELPERKPRSLGDVFREISVREASAVFVVTFDGVREVTA